MNQEDDPEEVRRLLDERGYRCVFRSRSGPNVLRYKAPENGQDVDGYVSLEKKPRQDSYDIAFGVASRAAVQLLEAAEPLLRAGSVIPVHSLGPPHVVWFSAGRLLGCTLINIPDRTDRRSLRQVLGELVSSVLQPFVEGPNSSSDVLAILRRNDMPFEWVATNPAKRALHLAATARALEIGRQEVENELLAVRNTLRGDLNREQPWGELVGSIVSVLWAPNSARH